MFFSCVPHTTATPRTHRQCCSLFPVLSPGRVSNPFAKRAATAAAQCYIMYCPRWYVCAGERVLVPPERSQTILCMCGKVFRENGSVPYGCRFGVVGTVTRISCACAQPTQSWPIFHRERTHTYSGRRTHKHARILHASCGGSRANIAKIGRKNANK